MHIIKCTLQAGGIGIWTCWFLWREENQRTRRKTLGARTRTNNKLNLHMTPRQRPSERSEPLLLPLPLPLPTRKINCKRLSHCSLSPIEKEVVN